MKKQPTLNIQRPTSKNGGAAHWLFEVECWMLKVSRFRLASGILVLLASAAFAFAQSNGVPGPADYTKFSAFVTDRNIFDPNRVPHSYSPTTRTRTRTRARNSAPGIMLVGTMSYEKGMFAFFNGNSADLKKALQAGEKIADYTVTEISPSRVMLESADKKQQLKLQVGDGLRQENGKWVFSGSSELPAGNSSAETPSSSSGDGSSEAGATLAPSSAAEPNDVLKRLMQLREKENK
jgi:hypothetical protein